MKIESLRLNNQQHIDNEVREERKKLIYFSNVVKVRKFAIIRNSKARKRG